MKVPFFRPSIGDAEIAEVVHSLKSGWLTTGPMTRRFEEEFARAVNAPHAVALNSCTAALHLAAEALGLRAPQAVLVPTMTFAASAEIVSYMGAFPVLVDCDDRTGHLDLDDAEAKIELLRQGKLLNLPADTPVAGIVPVHVAGLMMDVAAVNQFAARHGLWVIEDAAHSFPAAWRASPSAPWRACGESTATVTCYSFYANKTITTGEGGMAVTDRADLADRMRLMSLHGLSRDAWNRYRQGAAWDYRILEPGYKYNMTDLASALGVVQLARAEELRRDRERLARTYLDELADVDPIVLPPVDFDRLHAWHLFPIRLNLDRLDIDRDAFIARLNEHGIGTSVHWRPLHLHPHYQTKIGWPADLFPVATREWLRRLTLPLFPGMTVAEQRFVIDAVKSVCVRHRRGAGVGTLASAGTT